MPSYCIEVAPPRVNLSQTMAFRCGVQTPSITATLLHSESSAQPASFDRSMIIVLPPPKNILKVQILDSTRYLPGLLVIINQSPMNLKPPEQFLFSPNHLLRNGLTIDLADQPGRRRASSQIYSSNPGTWIYLPIQALKPWEGVVFPHHRSLKHGTDLKKPLKTGE